VGGDEMSYGPDWDNEYVEHLFKESVADLVHATWAHWMKYMFTQCEDDDLGYVIPHDKVRRWMRQMNTEYGDLPEREKGSDREIAAKYISLFEGRP
jgi:hypothetical protein